MPMSGSNYVAPTWVDKAPPALDAAELQAMCNTIMQNQGDVAALETALQQAVQSLTTAVSGKAQIVTGSYVGTGTSGSTNPNTITFRNVPKVVFISSSDGYGRGIFINGARPFISNDKDGGNYSISVYGSLVEWSGNTLTWWSLGTARDQLNASGLTYTYRSFF